MRSIIRGLLVENDELTDIIPPDRWIGAGALTEDNLPPIPFAVIRFGLTNPGMGDVYKGSVTFWVHDTRGTYESIDRVLSLIAGSLDGREHVSDEDGNELIIAEWQSNSGDLFDTGYRTITKTSTYQIVGKGV